MEQRRKGKSATPRGIKTSRPFQMLHAPSFTVEDAMEEVMRQDTKVEERILYTCSGQRGWPSHELKLSEIKRKKETFPATERIEFWTHLYCLHREDAVLPRVQDFQDGGRNAEADFMPFHLTFTTHVRHSKFHIWTSDDEALPHKHVIC